VCKVVKRRDETRKKKEGEFSSCIEHVALLVKGSTVHHQHHNVTTTLGHPRHHPLGFRDFSGAAQRRVNVAATHQLVADYSLSG